jgi:acetylornithine deacetylase
MLSAVDYARELIEFDSVSSQSNAPVTECVARRLRELGGELERIDYIDPRGVPKANVLAKIGAGSGGLAYFGHTDVVPAADWKFDDHGPFQPVIREGRLYGRGSTDMKGSIACFLAAVASLAGRPLSAPIYICCTADEEVGMLGAMHVAGKSRLYQEMVAGQTRAIVGEPTRLEVVYGHKGGCGVKVIARGRAAHSSTSQGINANWAMIPFLAEMKVLRDELETDPRFRNAEFDPPTMSLNLGINDHNSAINITSPQSVCTLYFRAMPGVSADPVLQRIQASAAQHGLEVEQLFRATPFYAGGDAPFVRECLEFATSPTPRTVSYGTDAARLTHLKHCVVMGPGDIAQAHTHDEWVSLSDLEQGTQTYRKMLERWCAG